MNTLEDALAIAGRGLPVFPARDKKPLVKWQDVATTDEARIRQWWAKWPDSLIGVPMPAGTVAVDIDDLDAVKSLEASGELEFTKTAGQQTEHGGFHFFYRTDGRPVAQIVKRGGIGLDTRVGGKGYVIAYDAAAFVPGEWAAAPEWVYEGAPRPSSPQPAEAGPMGTRDDILAWMGRFALDNLGIAKAELLAVLKAKRDGGGIVALDPKRPWTDGDLEALAGEGAEWAREPDWWPEDGITRENYREREQNWQRSMNILVTSIRSPKVPEQHGRGIRLTAASDITPRRVRWLYEGRLAMGSVSLIGGREGQGKTLLANALTAQVTRGTLPGENHGAPRNVIVVTTEDAWDQTIVPRLMANGADLARVFRAEAVAADGFLTGLSLPHDIAALEESIREKAIALVVLDPLLSRLDGSLDTHKDADVRRALEPLVALAERTGAHVTGLIHVNKSATTDALTSLMASRAFAAVARAVLFVMKDPEEDGIRLVGQPKNNLGRTDMDTMRFAITAVVVGQDPDDGEDIKAPRLDWMETTTRSVEDALVLMAQGGPKRASKQAVAEEWVIRYLRQCDDGRAKATEVKDAAARTVGHTGEPISAAALQHARTSLSGSRHLIVEKSSDGAWYWQLSTAFMLSEAGSGTF